MQEKLEILPAEFVDYMHAHILQTTMKALIKI